MNNVRIDLDPEVVHMTRDGTVSELAYSASAGWARMHPTGRR